MKLIYRPDIDGMRAIAVLAVLVNHAGIRYFPGGFIGVDIFFVISGYLITGIILRELDAGEFSLLGFYERRVRRIYPALFASLLATTAAAWILYDSYALFDFSKSLFATTFFWSNILFWTQSGYFEGESQLRPLLHTWSLAVEEQFYIFFPVIMAGLARYLKPSLKYIVAGLAALSFVWELYAMQIDPSGAFYFAHLRAWELLLGSLLALRILPVTRLAWLRILSSCLGLGMILAPIFIYTENTSFPGFAAAIPALGAALLIYSGSEKTTFVNRLLSMAPLVFVGQISYSLYLWHWPLLKFVSYYAIVKLSRVELLLLLGTIFVIATLSWHFIEKPFRAKSTIPRSILFRYAGVTMVCAAALSGWLYINRGFPDEARFSTTPLDEVWEYEACNFLNSDTPAQLDACLLGDASQPTSFLLWGDSHASAYAKGVALAATRNQLAGELTYAVGCPPLVGVAASRKSPCLDFTQQTLAYLRDHPEIKNVFLSARWAQWAEGVGYKQPKTFKLVDTFSDSPRGLNAVLLERGLTRTVAELQGMGRRVIFISQAPEVKYYVTASLYIAQRTHRDVNDIIAPTLAEYQQRNEKATVILDTLGRQYDVTILDPWRMLCDAQRCNVAIGNEPLYMDDNHLSLFGAEYLAPLYEAFFENLTQPQR